MRSPWWWATSSMMLLPSFPFLEWVMETLVCTVGFNDYSPMLWTLFLSLAVTTMLAVAPCLAFATISLSHAKRAWTLVRIDDGTLRGSNLIQQCRQSLVDFYKNPRLRQLSYFGRATLKAPARNSSSRTIFDSSYVYFCKYAWKWRRLKATATRRE